MTTPWILSASLIAAGAGEIELPRQLRIEDVQVTLIAEVRAPARETGVLAELSVAEGDRVEVGAELGRLDSDLAAIDEKLARIDYLIAELQSENDVDRRYAKKSLEVSQTERERALASNKLYPKSVSKTNLERLQLLVDKAELSIEQAERDLDMAELTKQLKEQTVGIAGKHLEQRRVVAPISGIVAQVYRKPGEWLDAGEPVVRIIQMDRLRVEAFVDGRKFGHALLGRPVRLTTALPPGDHQAHFEGSIVFVSPEVQPVNGQVRVWAEVENKDYELRPGTRGTLTIQLAPTHSTTKSHGPQAR